MSCSRIAYDGKRGEKGVGGWWIDLEEAQTCVVGNEAWWHHAHVSKSIEMKQYDKSGPADKLIWMYSNGDMYLGEWHYCPKKCRLVEHGMGATYIHSPPRHRGVVYVGEWKYGDFYGSARAFWLESSPTWIKNELGDTGIRQETDNGKFVGRPYSYSGLYVDNVETDQRAVVSLKDGTTRIGHWNAGKPVGDWWTDHQSVAAAAAAAPPLPTATLGKNEKKRSMITPSKKRKQEGESDKTCREKKMVKPAARRTLPPTVSPAGRAEASQAARWELGEGESAPHAEHSTVTNQEISRQDENMTVSDDNHDLKEEKIVHTDRDREEEIAQWLVTVIGYNPDKDAMKGYAKKFMELGLHSSQMISDLLPANRVATFAWMKEFHRLQFLSNANLKR